jgi:L-Ala-D/L-Glu epimerase
MDKIDWIIEVQRLPLKYPFGISRGRSIRRDTIRLGLRCAGLTGWGEAAPNPRYCESTESTLAALEGLSTVRQGAPFAYRAFLLEHRRRLGAGYAARAAFDMAVHDWYGKAIDLALSGLVGADPSAMRPTSFTIGIDRPEVMAKRAAEAAQFQVLKVKLGAPGDRSGVEAIRRVTSVPIRVDANEGWADPDTALREIEWLADRGVEFVEQPLPARMVEEMIWLKARSPLPLIADESVCRPDDLIRAGEGFHGINIKLMKCGGILPALELISLAREAGLTVMMGCMVESSCGVSGAAHLAPLADYVDLDSNLMLAEDPFTGHPVREGRIRLSPSPGLGVDLKSESP